MSRLALLLRAVNVGGTGKLVMAEFRQALAELGYDGVQTLGAAGSAVVGAGDAPDALEARIESELRTRFDLATDVLARPHGDLAEVLAANPFGRLAEEDPSHLLVMFLKGEPDPAALDGLRERFQGPEEFAAGPRSLYIAYGAAMARSKLTNVVIERALGLRGTGRNWNTVRKLAELTAP